MISMSKHSRFTEFSTCIFPTYAVSPTDYPSVAEPDHDLTSKRCIVRGRPGFPSSQMRIAMIKAFGPHGVDRVSKDEDKQRGHVAGNIGECDVAENLPQTWY